MERTSKKRARKQQKRSRTKTRAANQKRVLLNEWFTNQLADTAFPNTLFTVRTEPFPAFVFQHSAFRFPGVHSVGVPPVPIPNTAVKTDYADNTRGANPRKDR